MQTGEIETKREESPFKFEITELTAQFYLHKPAALEALHWGIRVGEDLIEEFGYLVKRLGGKRAVLEVAEAIERMENKKIAPLARMLRAWLADFGKAIPKCSLYSYVTLFSSFSFRFDPTLPYPTPTPTPWVLGQSAKSRCCCRSCRSTCRGS